ncbi:MAG: tRNA pseudouridine(55) synthase TruB [Lachnospiraceae bacterium]|nr:tRNA pseudouridine(55) synthase TruB [Lachnospiraceae bacterium]
MYNGILNVYKEKGYTSHDVVAKLRGICKQKKIGHTGTLDPDAVGVLPVCLGNATKLCDMLTDKSKEYEAEFLLGVTTDTQDISGQVKEEREVNVTEEQVREAVLSFKGAYDQIPPMYSALKVNGKKLYELARQGVEVERRARRVEIHEIQILSIAMPYIRMRVHCSKGTYIRTLGVDIGEKLGCGAVMTVLKRTRVGTFTAENALTLSQIEALRDQDILLNHMVTVEEVFQHLRRGTVKVEFRKFIDNGNAIREVQLEEQNQWQDGEEIRIYNNDGAFCGIFQYRQSERLCKPVKMFPMSQA